jgi:hypothetical protein
MMGCQREFKIILKRFEITYIFVAMITNEPKEKCEECSQSNLVRDNRKCIFRLIYIPAETPKKALVPPSTCTTDTLEIEGTDEPRRMNTNFPCLVVFAFHFGIF